MDGRMDPFLYDPSGRGRGSNNAMTIKFFKDFINNRKNRIVVLEADLSQTFSNTRTIDETFQQSGKQSFFNQILKNQLFLGKFRLRALQND